MIHIHRLGPHLDGRPEYLGVCHLHCSNKVQYGLLMLDINYGNVLILLLDQR
nr:MAG TPA: hypothetical protein [Myoviridae sp. ctfuG5]